MTPPRRLLVFLIAPWIGLSLASEQLKAGDRHHRRRVIVSSPRAVAPTTGYRLTPTQRTAPLTRTEARYLGTFRPSATMVVSEGYGAGLGFAPAGNPSQAGSMSLYGPFSRLRTVPRETVFYSRGFDGRPIPTGSELRYRYQNPSNFQDTSLLPTVFQLDRRQRFRSRSPFAPYLLGQE